ncbi:MAG: hypothetical protein DWI68_04390, partial [Chloroflexi bacterium]
GERRLNMMRAFNAREGIGRESDTLPKKFMKPLAGGKSDGYMIDSNQFEDALNTYYRLCEWDAVTGNPTPAKLNSLGLGWLVVDGKQPARVKVAAGRSAAAKKTGAKKPAIKQPIAKKVAAKKPGAKKRAVKKPAAKKPVAKKPIAQAKSAAKPKPAARKRAAKAKAVATRRPAAKKTATKSKPAARKR